MTTTPRPPIPTPLFNPPASAPVGTQREGFIAEENDLVSFDVPELFPGFQELTRGETVRYEQLQDRSARISSQLNDINRKVRDAADINILGAATAGEAAFGGAALAGFLRGKENVFDPTPELLEDKKKLEFEQKQLVVDFQRTQWRLGIVALLPAAFIDPDERERFSSVELLTSLAPGAALTDEDKAFAQSLINGLSNQRGDLELITEGMSAEDKKLIEELQQPGANFHPLRTIDPSNKTASELVDIVRAARKFRRPEGVSVEDLRQVLRDRGVSREELQRLEVEHATQVAARVALIRDDATQMDIVRRELQDQGTLGLSSTVREKMLEQKLSHMAAIALMPLELHNKYIGDPFRGVVLGSLASARIIGGSPIPVPGSPTFYKAFEQGRADGKNIWMSYGQAYDEWDTNAVLKLGIDIVLDPLNVVGMTWFSGIVRPLPLVGRTLARWNEGYRRMAEAPFDWAKRGIGKIPKTVLQRGQAHALSSFDTMSAVAYQVHNQSLRNLDTSLLRQTGETAIELAMLSPNIQDNLTSFGLHLLPNRIISPADLSDLGRILGETLVDTPAMLTAVNTVKEGTLGFGVSLFSTPGQSARYLMRTLGILDDAVSSKTVKIEAWLKGIQQSMRTGALRRLQGNDMGTIIGNVMDGARDDFVAATESVIANDRYQQGLIAGMLTNVDKAQKAVFSNLIDRWVTTPFSRSYLMFGFYGIGNILETTLIKTGIGAGLNPFGRLSVNSHVTAARKFAPYTGVPENITMGGNYVLEMGATDTTLRAMAQSARGAAGSKPISTAMKDTRPLIEKVLIPNFKRIGNFDVTTAKIPFTDITPFPRGIGSASLTGFDYFNRAGNAALANYWNRWFDRLVGERFPDIMLTVDNLTRHITRELEQVMDPNQVDAARRVVNDQLMSGDLNFIENGIRDTIQPNAIRAGVLADLLSKQPDLEPAVRDLLIQRGLDGTLWSMGTAGINRYFKDDVTTLMMEKYMSGPQFYLDNLASLADEVDAMVPATLDELKFKTTVLGDMVDLYGDSVHYSLRSAGLFSSNITDVRIKEEFWQTWWEKRIEPVLQPIDSRIAETSRVLREQLTRDTPLRAQLEAEGKLPHYLSFIDSLAKSRTSIIEARTKQLGIRNNYFTSGGANYVAPGQRSNQFWSNFFAENDAMWNDVERARLSNMEAAWDSAFASEVISIPQLVDVSTKTLTPADIAKVFGVDSQQISKYMYIPEMNAIRGRKEFTERIFGQANRIAKTQQKTADQLGYSREKIRAVYDDLIGPLQARTTGEGSGFENVTIQLENVRQELIRMNQRKQFIASDETAVFWRDRVYGSTTQEQVLETTRRRTTDELIEAGGGIQGIKNPNITDGPDITPDQARDLIRSSEQMILPGEEKLFEDILRVRNNLSGDQSILDDRLPSQIEDFLNVDLPITFDEAGAEILDIPAAIRLLDEAVQNQDAVVKRIVDRNTRLQIDIDDQTSNALERGLTELGPEEAVRTTIPSQPIPSELRRIVEGGEGIPGSTPEQIKAVFDPEWRKSVQDNIIPEIQRNWVQDFPDYNGANVISSVMKTVFPFWHYEAHRVAWWLPREFVRHPGTYHGFGSYKDNTDEGYFNIPNTPLDINPMRGNIYMGGARRLFQRDYPEYYDNFAGTANVLDEVSKYGFYTGAPIQIWLSTFGAKRGMTLGENLPPVHRSILDVITAIKPDSTAVKKLRDVVFNDNFKSYLTGTAITRQGGDGSLLLSKIRAGESFTPEEEQQWANGQRERALYGPLMEMTGLFRYSPEEKRELRAASYEVMAELMEVDVEILARVLEDGRRNGLNFEDLFGAQSIEMQDALRALDGWTRWTGFGVVLAPSEFGEQVAITRQMWSLVEENNKQENSSLQEVEDLMQITQDGRPLANITTWTAALRETTNNKRVFFDALNDPETPLGKKYIDIPKTLEERVEFAQKWGLPTPIFSGMEELRNYYFQIQVKKVFNPDTGLIEDDWDLFYAEQEAIRLGMPEDVETQFDSLIAKDDTPLQRRRRELYQDLFKIYYQTTRQIVMAEFTKEQQVEINRFLATASPEERSRIRDIDLVEGGGSGRSLIADYQSRIRNTRQNLRDTDIELDAWLTFFNGSMTPRTTQAAARRIEIARSFGVAP